MRSFRRRAGVLCAGIAVGALAALGLTAPAQAATSGTSAATVSGRNLPADGKVLSVMGQDSDTLSAYKRDVLDKSSLNAPKPGGVTLYTNLVLGGSPEPLAGMNGPVNWGSGTVDFNSTLAQYPGAALAVGLYLSDATSGCNNQPLRAIIGTNDSDVTSGNPSLTAQYRAKVDDMVTKLKGYDRQVFLRIGYEFDGPWNCYSADYYKKAFQYIKGRIDALGATKVATVWQTAAWPLNTNTDHPEWNYVVTDPAHYDTWYPGDAYVDWVGLSAFYTSGSLATQWGCSAYDTSPTGLQNRVLDFARGHGKPVMIAESSPQGYDNGAATKSCIMKKGPVAANSDARWNEWYKPYFSFIAANRDVIRAAAYINTDWDSQTQWQCADGANAGGTGCGNGYWGDARVQADPVILDRFLAELRGSQWVGGTGTGGGTDPGDGGGTDPGNGGGTDPGDGGGTNPGNGAFTQGVTAGGQPAIWFKPGSDGATWVTVHYRKNGAAQENYFLTWNAGAGRWELPVNLRAGDSLSYSFDYLPQGKTAQESTATYTYRAS
ncbi:endo-1,3-beta-xylanase [Streptomyces sp. NPDC088923]|uniref:endo-1,3-beta-xylanase n=1 Tax=Streptomyces sp. NPDC088923 TaxID=3365913 RepID=UPI0038175C13